MLENLIKLVQDGFDFRITKSKCEGVDLQINTVDGIVYHDPAANEDAIRAAINYLYFVHFYPGDTHEQIIPMR